MKRLTSPIAALLCATTIAVVGLAGCAAGSDFTPPPPPSADRYTAEPTQVEAAAAAASQAGAPVQQIELGADLGPEWWRRFGSPALDDLVARALAHNRTLDAAAATLAQAEELAAAQAGTLAPQVDATAGAGRQKYGEQFLGPLPKPPPFSYFSVGATVSYTLDYTGGAARSVEQQRALADVQRQRLEAARLAVAGNAVMQALRIASLRAQIATVDALLDRDRENLKLVHLAFAAGSVSRLDIVAAESQLASDTTLRAPLRQELSVAEHALAIELGVPPAAAALPEFDLAQLQLPRELPVSLPSELARRRPDILAAEAQLHAATAAVGVAEANLYPHITLSADTGQQSATLAHLFDASSNVWSLAAGLVAPIFDGGTLRAEERASADALRASSANYEQTVLVAFGQVADSLQALDHGAEQLQAQSRAQDAARDNVDLTRMSYHEGNVGVLQVLDAERLYQQARLGYVRAEAQRYSDTAQLFLALGGSGPEPASAPQ
jgi:NodT family efflux transporter outer membrane factor (OMF) lipoprotein